MIPAKRRKARKLAKTILLSLSILAAPGVAWAAMAVIDSAAIAKLGDQLTKLQQQIEVMTGIKDRVQQQIDAVGRMGQISLPSINISKLASQIKRDAQCLKPDLSKLMPGVSFDDVSMGSICDTAPVYEQTLWIDPDKINAMPNWQDRERARHVVERRREAVLKDSVTKGMAMADQWIAQSEDENRATEELASAAAAAKTTQDRQQVTAQGQVLIARALAKQNQILAQQLRVQSAFAAAAGVPIESYTTPKDKTGKEGGK